jgi:hypothetical protein
MTRRLVLNWNKAHKSLEEAVKKEVTDPAEIGEVAKGWTYVTFFPPRTEPGAVLFNLEHVKLLAQENAFFLPREVVIEHNKVVISASSPEENPVFPLLALYRLLETYAGRFADPGAYPKHGFYGKFGGVFDRPEKGRVLVMYSGDDDALADIYESVEKVVAETSTEGIRYGVHLSNGLSALPRMLHGFDDPQYKKGGTTHYRIVDPSRFLVLLEQAKKDYSRYLFE